MPYHPSISDNRHKRSEIRIVCTNDVEAMGLCTATYSDGFWWQNKYTAPDISTIPTALPQATWLCR